MPNRYIDFYPNTYYHIYNKSLTEDTVFHDHTCYKRFYDKMIQLWKDEFKKYSFDIAAYCLLPNHYHLVLIYTWKQDFDPITSFMHRLQTSYSMYYNKRYKRKWPLFQWRFKAKPIQQESYLQECFVYVNFNAVKHWIVDDIKDWDYTSFHLLDNLDKKQYKSINKNIWILNDLEF